MTYVQNAYSKYTKFHFKVKQECEVKLSQFHLKHNPYVTEYCDNDLFLKCGLHPEYEA